MPSSIPAPPPSAAARPPIVDPLKAALGNAVVGLWGWWYKVKNNYIGSWIAAVVFVLSLVELIGPLFHSDGLVRFVLHSLPANYQVYFRSVLMVLLMIAASALFYSHKRLERSERGLKRLIHYLKWLAEYRWSNAIEPLKPRLTTILDGLLDALNEHKKSAAEEEHRANTSKLNASILILDRARDQSAFMLLAQDSKETFSWDTEIPRDGSVAGNVVEKSKNEKSSLLLYVPWTKFAHGWSFRSPVKDGQKISKEMQFMPTTFCELEQRPRGQNFLGCLLCVWIPITQGSPILLDDGTQLSDPVAVLSLSSPKAESLNNRTFDASRLVSRLLAQVLTEKAGSL